MQKKNHRGTIWEMDPHFNRDPDGVWVFFNGFRDSKHDTMESAPLLHVDKGMV